jgi:hypothetical protein
VKLILASTLATASLSIASPDPPTGGNAVYTSLNDSPLTTTVVVVPLTAVVITQCNDLISVIITMPDGTLRHFGPTDGLSHDEAIHLAEEAVHSIQVQVHCQGEKSI